MTAPDAGAVRAERLLATGVAVFRVGTVALLAAAVLSEPTGDHRFVPMATITGLVAVESLAFAARCRRSGVLGVRWVAADVLAVATAFALTSPPWLAPGPPGLSRLYNFALISSIEVGVAPWSLAAALGIGLVFTGITVGSSLLPGGDYPLWNAVPDGLSFVGTVLAAWVVSRLVRHAHREHDRQRALAAGRSAVLARERERARQAGALRVRLLSTLDAVVAADAVVEPVLAAQLRREVAWLHGVVEGGLDEPAVGLLTGLRDLAAEKAASGLAVDVRLPDTEPALSAGAREALLGAAREALTNVAKHAETGAATVRVTVGGGWVTVAVEDRGKGYDPGTVAPRTGLTGSVGRRVAAAAGRSTVRSAPGAGTTVELRVPEEPR